MTKLVAKKSMFNYVKQKLVEGLCSCYSGTVKKVELTLSGKNCRLFGSDKPGCLLIQPSARHENATLEAEAAQMAELSGVPFVLATIELEDWIPFAKKHAPMADAVYLSLGAQEENVKNQAIARVGNCLRAQHSLLQEQIGANNCTLFWEPGDHFNDNDGRLARAFAWCIERLFLGHCLKTM